MWKRNKATRHVEVVVVHGMGRQKAGETLLEWSEALLKRIDWYAKGRLPAPAERAAVFGVAPFPQTLDKQTEPSTVEFGHVLLTSDEDEVIARVTYRGAGNKTVTLSLRFTEARWSEAFPALSKSQVFGWGLGFVWRTATRVGRYLTNLFFASGKGFIVRPLGWLLAALATALAWVLTMVGAGILTVFLALAGPLLLIPFTAKLLAPVVDILVDFVGDVPVWSRHPVRAAAMAGIVTDKLKAARAKASKADDEVVVIAHSEGAAITANVLFAGMSKETPRVDTLVTVGAAVTLIGRTGWTNRQVKGGSRRADGKAIDLVTSWAEDLKVRVRWINFWASWDIVPSGPISTGFAQRRRRWAKVYERGASRVESAELGPEEHLVHNTGSLLGDHQSYAVNVIQVADPIARQLLALDGPVAPGKATVGPVGADAEQLRRRNAAHVYSVKALGLHRILIVALALLALLLPVARHRLEEAFPWIARIRDGFITAFNLNPKEGFGAWLLTLDWLPLAILLSAAAAILIWLNAFVWRKIEGSLVQKSLDQSAGIAANLVFVGFRVVLVTLIGLVVAVLNQDEWLNNEIGILAVVIGMVVIWFPVLGRVPRVVEQNRG